jgi:hydrophobic/amphiphilic exporter-1 (mainly G- bacteria), HAE1 family
MWISNTSIKRPVFATMVIMSFMVLGIVSMTRLGVDLFPDVNFPFINVTVVYPGAAPEEVETLVTKPIEDAVAGINGVKRIESNSRESFARVGIELRLEVDPQQAAAEVREKVAAIRGELPKEIEDPTIQRFDVAALPVMTFAVGSTKSSDVTRRTIEDKLKPLIEQIDGVAAVQVNGGEVREIQINLDPGRLEALGLPVSVVADKLALENLDLPAGKVIREGRNISLRTKGEFETPEEIETVILRSLGGSTVRVKDVGTVVDGYEERDSTTRLNGVDAVSFSVRKQSGANTVEISTKVHALLARVAPTFPDLQINPIHDDAEFIRSNVEEVRSHIIFGGLMAVLVIFVFMRDWRSTLISALALPTSVIATFFFMYVAGFTINMMTLMALSLVIGILIDDAVVVRENIYRHMEMGEDPVTAARNGTSQIGLAVMATTFTILAVFLPVGFMTGIVGQFFKSFALTIAFAVAMSLLVAFTLDPMLSSRFVRFIPEEERNRTRIGRFFEGIGHQYDKLDGVYHRVLGWSLDRPWTVLAIATGVFVLSLSMFSIIGTEFVPEEDRAEFQVLVDLPPGTSFDESVAQVAHIEQMLGKVPEVRQVFTTVGLQGEVRSSSLRVRLTKKDQRRRGLAEIKQAVRRDLSKLPFAEIRVADPEFMQGAPYQPPIDLYVRGDDMRELQRISDELVSKIRQVPGAVDVKSSLVAGQPEMVARINRELAADIGFDVGGVAAQLRGMVEGIVATKLRDGEREHDIRVRLAPEFRNNFAAIAGTPLYTPTGTVVRTADLVSMLPAVGPSSIDREQRRRQVKVGVDLAGRPLGDVTADVEKAIATVKMPANFEAGFAGDVEMMQESAQAMGLALLLAVAFIYIVLASQFESFTEPMLIMVSLPLALVGALLALLVTGNHIGMPAMIGVVMLMGLVTKNAILLVDYTNQLHREEGLSVRDALLKAGPVRLRPIVMTTLAMILGMLPSAMGRGDGGEFRAPISVATIGGLITSTLLTLVVVPVSYLLLQRWLAWLASWRQRPRAQLSPALRVTGMLLLALLLGAIVAAANAFGEPLAPQSAPAAASSPTPVPARLTFERALEIALRENKPLKVSHESVREAEGRVAEARANFLPSVNLAFDYTPAQQFPLIRIPAGIFGPEEQTFQAAFTRQNIMQMTFSQPLYTGGRLRNAYAIQAAASDEARLNLERAQQQLTLQVVEAFYRALLQEQGLAVAEQGVRLAEQQLGIAKTRFEAGSAARFDVLRAEVDLANAHTTLIRARSSRDIAYQGLRTVLSMPPETPIALDGTLEQIETLPEQTALLGSLDRRPDVRAVGAQRTMAERSVALAASEWKPSFALNGNLQYQQDGFNSTFLDTDNRSYSVGFSIRIPLLSTPGAMARKATAEAQVRQARNGLEAALDNGRLEVTSAYTEWVSSKEVVDAQRKALDLARESLAIAQVSYENGLITSIELSDARQALLETEWNLAQAKFAQILAAARTRFAAGIS